VCCGVCVAPRPWKPAYLKFKLNICASIGKGGSSQNLETPFMQHSNGPTRPTMIRVHRSAACTKLIP
jgi:hypothetical protein